MELVIAMGMVCLKIQRGGEKSTARKKLYTVDTREEVL
jgi:hypothetical protein